MMRRGRSVMCWMVPVGHLGLVVLRMPMGWWGVPTGCAATTRSVPTRIRRWVHSVRQRSTCLLCPIVHLCMLCCYPLWPVRLL